MQAKIDLITVMTDNVAAMKIFFRDVLGFQIVNDMDQYIEFENEGVRFAVCARSVLEQATGHADFKLPRGGQAFGLAFPCQSPADVDKSFAEIVTKGATPIAEPAPMPWGQHTGFFADPEGNIHELFADL